MALTFREKLAALRATTFDGIRQPSVDYVNRLSQAERDILFDEIERGVAILTSEAQLHMYMFSYGKMHQAKLREAFDKIGILRLLGKELSIIDYGCGQGIGSIVFIDFLKKKKRNFTISSVKLIEPSTLALNKAKQNIENYLRSYNQNATIQTFCKELDEIKTIDLQTNSSTGQTHHKLINFSKY